MTETRWERMTAPELRALAERNAVVILPVAALEQHGPHLPVWTDSFIGHSVAIRAAELCADLPAVVLPPMWMGMESWRSSSGFGKCRVVILSRQRHFW